MTRTVLVLAGGGSRRLGRDKQWVVVGGAPVLARVVGAARGALGDTEQDILVSVGDPAPFRDRFETDPELYAGVRLIPDEVSGAGPVAGLARGLAAARGAAVVVVAADMPFVSADLIRSLFDELEAAPEVDAIIPTVEGRDQPLCAAYRAAVGTVAAELISGVESRADDGREPGFTGPSVAALLDRIRVQRVDTIAGHGPGDLSVQCRGIDTPADLEWALGIAAGS